MADENLDIRRKFRKEVVDTNGGPWIRCPSQSHGGKMYYFNKSTGKAVWDLSDADMIKADPQTIPIEGPAVPCRPEPAEPPRDSASYSTYPDSNQTIYNKQIINNQFAKPFAGPPYVSPQCHFVKLIPAIWNVPPAPYYLSPVPTPPDNQVEPSQGNYVNRQRFNKFNPQWKQNLLTNKAKQKFHNDLREILSSRRKDFIKEEGASWNTHKEQGNVSTNDVCEEAINITEDDLCPSDVDEEWLKINSSGESNTIDTSPIWRLDRGDAHPDFSFLVPTMAVLLNHLTFLSRLVKSDARLRLLTPAAELRRLRARTAGPAPRLPRRARAAVRFATLQMHKVPVNLKNLQDGNIASCCMELIKQKYLVILIMTDEEESENRYMYDEIPTFTISDLKECLAQHPCAPKTESRENNVSVISNELYTSTNLKDHEDICKDNNSAPASAEPMQENTSIKINKECNNDNNPGESKCIEIKKDQVTSLVKRTANASVQTDFEHNATLSIESANSSSIVRALETDHTLRVETFIESSNDSKEEPKVVKRKFKLNRCQAAPKIEPVKQTTVKWRKRRVEPLKTNVNPNINEETHTLTDEAPLMDVRTDLLQTNDSAEDFGNNTEISERNAHMDENGSNKESISVISNSVESETMFRVNKKAILSQSVVNEDIHMFGVTDESMREYLVMRRDEWVSRFVQIMEEALTQVLQSEPRREPAMPPPWSVHEATLCVKRNFENNTEVVFASDKLTTVLHQISDSKGTIKPDVNPNEFMRMYSYGVNLIKHLQDVLNDSEDLLIAKTSLSKLLVDIRDPNLDVSHNTFIDTFDDEQTSNTEVGMSVSEDTLLAPESPRAAPPPSHQSSPAKYNLRSQQQKVTSPAMSRPAVEDNCFFTSLRLQRNDSGDSASKALNTTDPTSSPRETDNAKQPEPKIIRQFNVCADFEERLKKKRLLEEVDDEYFAEDHCTATEFYLGAEDAGTPAGKDAADAADDADDADDADARTVLKWFMSRTTYPIHRVLVEIQRFCTDTYKELNKNERLEPEYITKLSAKTAKVTVHMNNLCKYLNRILHRDTRSKFSYMLQQLGYEDAPMSPAQQAEYGAVVKRYLGQASILLEAVNLIAEAVRVAEYSTEQLKS